jgi:hypothetical protein
MVFFLLGVLALLVLMGALGAFSRADVTSIKQFGLWTLAIGGLLLSVLLLFTRGPAGLGTLLLLGPLLWSWVGQARGAAAPRRPQFRRPAAPGGSMTREEAFQVLGLKPGATEADIRAAYHRLMRAAHPDAGGSDWLAARINQARDVLLG